MGRVPKKWSDQFARHVRTPPPILHDHQGDGGDGREGVDRGDEGDGGRPKKEKQEEKKEEKERRRRRICHDGGTTEQGKIELLSRWTMEG